MTQTEIKNLNTAAMRGTISDFENPIFLFSTTNNSLLTKIISGEFDAKVLAQVELSKRGFSPIDGSWVGFDKAEELLNSIIEK